jgi:hypothetical protein
MAVLLTSGHWVNDGLLHKFGTSQATVAKGGEVLAGASTVKMVEFKVDLAVVAASTSQYILDETITIPSGAWIEKVVVQVLTETAGANANLDLGLVDQDRSTEIDFDGFLAAADVFNGGTDIGGFFEFLPPHQVQAGSALAITTEGGALLGTKLSNTGFVTANYNNAAFTAGVVVIRIYYSINPDVTP